MKHARAWLATLALVFPLAATGDPMTPDQSDVQATVLSMIRNFETGDIDAVMTAYEPEATVLFEPGAPVQDRAQLAAMFEGMAAANPSFADTPHEVIVQGDLALHIAPWSMTGRLPDGTEIAQSGLSVAVLRRQPGGHWQMVIDNPHGGRLLTQD